MAENNAIETNALLSDFSDEAADAVTGAEIRAAFGMSGTPNEFEFLKSLPFEMSSRMRRRFNATAGFRKIRLQDEGTEKINCDAISARIALMRLMFPSPCEPGVPAGNLPHPLTKYFGDLNVKRRQARTAANASGKLFLAAKPQVFLRFHLRHPEQMA
jgi:hypothetical protein